MKRTSLFVRQRAKRVLPAPCRRRRGVAAIYTAAAMVFLLTVTAMVVDMGSLYRARARAQRAADAAALGGAWQLSRSNAPSYADQWARYYAALPNNGGYVDGQNGASVTIQYPASDEQGVVHSNWYRVTVSRPEATFFGLASKSKSKYTVSATATALYTTNAPVDIRGVGTYGANGGVVNMSLFGPDGAYNAGDCYSVKYLQDKKTLNPQNVGWSGFNFFVNIPSSITNPEIDVFDPDCYNAGKSNDAGSVTITVNGQNVTVPCYDEIRDANGNNAPFDVNGISAASTVTQYTVYDDNGTPYDFSDDKQIYQTTYGGSSARDIAADGKWVPLVTNVTRLKPTSNFRVNVLSLSGSSENGYDLRAGPTLTGTQTYDPNNGSKIFANGQICLNFNKNGTTQIALGSIPVEAAGGNVNITHFDTDIGSTSLNYTCSTLPGFNQAGNLGPASNRNGVAYTDTFQIPKTYTTAGTWSATYAAGSQDTSCWSLTYDNQGPGTPGSIKLVR